MRGQGVFSTGSSRAEEIELVEKMKNRDSPDCIETKVFLQRFQSMSSQSILEELAAMGRGPAWFAREVADLFAREDVTGRLRLRLLDLVRKLIVQDESVKIKKEQMDRASDSELEALVSEIKTRYGLQEGAGSGQIAEHDRLPVAAAGRLEAPRPSRTRTAKKKSGGSETVQTAGSGPPLASIDRPSSSLEGRKPVR